MAMTAEQLYQARVWLPWDPPTDAELNTRFDTLAETDIYALVHEQLRRQLMLALLTPAQFTISGEYGQSTGENIKGIRSAITEIEGLMLAGAGGISTTQLVRPDPYRAGRTLPGTTVVGGSVLL